jgi:POT family proton-dependent oligopeptide transporter
MASPVIPVGRRFVGDESREAAYFGVLRGVAVAAGVMMFAIAPWISRQMEGVH